MTDERYWEDVEKLAAADMRRHARRALARRGSQPAPAHEPGPDPEQPKPEPPQDRVVDRTAQGEREWVNAEAEQRRGDWEDTKFEIDRERRSSRASLNMFQLTRKLVERLAKISTVPAGNVEPGRGGSDRAGPPAQQTFDQDPRWLEHVEVIESRLHRMHELLDEAEGLAPVGVNTMISEEKDRMILEEGVGLTPEGVVAKLGSDIAGSVSTVRRVRRAGGVSTKDGLPREAREPHMPEGPVRRVEINS